MGSFLQQYRASTHFLTTVHPGLFVTQQILADTCIMGTRPGQSSISPPGARNLSQQVGNVRFFQNRQLTLGCFPLPQVCSCHRRPGNKVGGVQRGGGLPGKKGRILSQGFQGVEDPAAGSQRGRGYHNGAAFPAQLQGALLPRQGPSRCQGPAPHAVTLSACDGPGNHSTLPTLCSSSGV